MGLLPIVMKFPDWMNELDQRLSSKSKLGSDLKPQLKKFKHEFANWRTSTEEGLLKLSLDVKDFAPNELIVRTTENTIVVEGRHAQKLRNKNTSRHFIRKYTLPKGINANNMITTLSRDGILTFKAPPNGLPLQLKT